MEMPAACSFSLVKNLRRFDETKPRMTRYKETCHFVFLSSQPRNFAADVIKPQCRGATLHACAKIRTGIDL
jgi:hypothetical protein